MKTNKKMNLRRKTKSSFVTKITCLLYIIFAMMSIACHNITNLGDLMLELITYTILGAMLIVGANNIDIKEIFKDMVE